MAKTTGDLLIDRLHEWGVDTIFGFPGDGINDLFESLRTHQDIIKFIQVRHEEAAAFAACGYAKYTGRLGVCMATSGPGGVHLLNGLYDAKMDNQPVLAITGHTFHDLIGTHYQQDVDLDKLFMDVAVYNERVMGPHHVVSVVDEAIKAALSRHGVAHMTIPKDIQGWTFGDEEKSPANIPHHSTDVYANAYPPPPQQDLQRAADVINAGKKVAILAGRGALGARAEVLQLAQTVAGPIVKPLLGKAVVPDDSPYTTGGIGLLGTSASQDAMEACDTLVMIGTSYPYMEFLPKPGQAKTVQIDIMPTRIGLRHPVEVGLLGDSKMVLQALLPLIDKKRDQGFLEDAQGNMRDWNKLMEARGTRQDMPMKPQVIAYQVNQALRDDDILVSDTGTVTTWAARHLMIRGNMMFSASGMLATMANGLPYAVGAAVGNPGRRVVAMVGDGGFTMLMCELATIAKYKLPVKVVLIKNDVLGEIKWEQMVLNANPQFGVQLHPIDFAKYAEAVGIPGYTIERPERCEATVREAFSAEGPALIQAVVDPNEPPLPGKITTKQALHMAEALAKGERDRMGIIKTVAEDFLNNRVREVV